MKTTTFGSKINHKIIKLWKEGLHTNTIAHTLGLDSYKVYDFILTYRMLNNQ